MKTNTIRAIAALFLSGALIASTRAEVELKDNSELLGKWLLEAVSPGLEKPKIAENRTWEFRADGVVVTSGFNRHFGREDTREFKYVVRDGIIKAEDPGRPGKTLDYEVYQKEGGVMILKGGLEGFYFFKKK